MLVSSSPFFPNSGLLVSAATSSATYLSTTPSSFDFTPSSIGTSPAASAAATIATGSGASSVSLVSVAVAVLAMIPNSPGLCRLNGAGEGPGARGKCVNLVKHVACAGSPQARDQAVAARAGIGPIGFVLAQNALLGADAEHLGAPGGGIDGDVPGGEIGGQIAGVGEEVAGVDRVTDERVGPALLDAPIRGDDAEAAAQRGLAGDGEAQARDHQHDARRIGDEAGALRHHHQRRAGADEGDR